MPRYDHGHWRPYVPVAQRRSRAQRYVRALVKQGVRITPVEVQGRKITRTFWGDAWCNNLEHYSDFANRLPRGRTYVRNGSVIHLGITKGKIEALVSGSEIYSVEVRVARTPAKQWKQLCKECTGQIDSLVSLLQGRLAEGVMERICRPKTGLFPTPGQIRLACSCPDWADMCKHVAATLYGVGCRLDEEPELLFRLRGVDEGRLIAQAAGRASATADAPTPKNVLQGDADLDELFGIELGSSETTRPPKGSRKRAVKHSPGAAAGRKTTKAKSAKKPPTRKKKVAKKAGRKGKVAAKKKAGTKAKAPATKKAKQAKTARKKTKTPAKKTRSTKKAASRASGASPKKKKKNVAAKRKSTGKG